MVEDLKAPEVELLDHAALYVTSVVVEKVRAPAVVGFG